MKWLSIFSCQLSVIGRAWLFALCLLPFALCRSRVAARPLPFAVLNFKFCGFALCLLPFALCLLLFAGCGKSAEQPSIPDEKMARIMADLCIAEAATTGLTGFPKDSLMQAYFRQTLELHSITLEDYEKNLRLYADDSLRMQRLTKQTEELLSGE